MELIKKIKDAEAQSQQIIEQAKADAAKLAEQGCEKRLAAMTQAEQQRKKAIEAAVARARSQGLTEVKKLKAQAENQRQQLRDKVTDKIAAAVAKVMEYLKG